MKHFIIKKLFMLDIGLRINYLLSVGVGGVGFGIRSSLLKWGFKMSSLLSTLETVFTGLGVEFVTETSIDPSLVDDQITLSDSVFVQVCSDCYSVVELVDDKIRFSPELFDADEVIAHLEIEGFVLP